MRSLILLSLLVGSVAACDATEVDSREGQDASDSSGGDVTNDAADVPDHGSDASETSEDPRIDSSGDTHSDTASDTHDENLADTHDEAEPDSEQDGARDSDVPNECVDGEQQIGDCMMCQCVGGAWDCYDSCNPDACLAACGVGCPAPEYQLCGNDGQLYCTSCQMGCYGMTEATDPAVCAACRPWVGVATIPWRLWTPPGDCASPFDRSAFFEVYTSEAGLISALNCSDPAATTGIDWNAERVVRVVATDNPSLAVVDVYDLNRGNVVLTTSEVYCGGAAPPTAVAYLVIPAGPALVDQVSCLSGHCTGPPRP